MQTNYRLFTDRPIHANLPDDDATGSVLETLAHAALMLILVGAFVLSGQHTDNAPKVSPAAVSNVAEAAPSPAPVVRSL